MPTEVTRFAAWARPPPSLAADLLPKGAECYRHPGQGAWIVCPHCGRFACKLCAVEGDDERLCAECFERDVSSGGRSLRYVPHLVQYDSLCLWMVLLPLLGVVTSGFTIFTAPLSLALILYHWRSPTSVLPRSQFRRWLALLLAGGVSLGWLVLIGWVIRVIITALGAQNDVR
ncbi:MAG: hypothetical protein N2652_02855 [Kiritimatiellae bacterium]|nr:hypothetical protein [Kiritimatiellia bacterium]